MRRLVLFMATVSLALPGAASLAADPPSIEPFAGSWKGREVSSVSGETPSPDLLSLEVQGDTDGFRMSWHDLSARDEGKSRAGSIDVRFSPTDRAGVYEYAPNPGSLLTRMFASPATGNPLKGETLLWARVEGPTLAVYSMMIDMEGGFDLDHYTWTRTGDELHLTFSERTEDLGVETTFEGELVADGG